MHTLRPARCLIAALTLALVSASRAAPRREDAPPPPQRNADVSRKLDLNSADRAALAAIPAIGPDLAPAVIAARPYRTLDDLAKLPGVSAERLEQIRARVIVIPPRTHDSLGLPMTSAPASSTATTPAPRKVDLNTADLATLSAVPGVGPDLAPVLIAARPFKSLDDLARLDGVSTERLELLRTQLEALPATLPRGEAKRPTASAGALVPAESPRPTH